MAANFLSGIAKEFIGKSMWDVFPKKIADRKMNFIKSVFKSKQFIIMQGPTVFQGNEYYFRTSIFPILDHDGNVSNVQLIAHDITEINKKEIRDAARITLLDKLRNTNKIDKCLSLGCQAIYEAKLYKRAVFTLHNEKKKITNLGSIGLEKEIVVAAKKSPPPNDELTKKMTQDKFKISSSFFIPVEADMNLNSSERYIPQKASSINSELAWMKGDELFSPVLIRKNKVVGWLSVDTPNNKLRPDVESVKNLEEIVEIVFSKIKDIKNQAFIKLEGHALSEKNVILKEVLSHIEEEKTAIKKQMADNIDSIILPAFEKIINKKGEIEVSYINFIKKHLMELSASSTSAVHNYSKLSRREAEICGLIADGNTNKEIAQLLNISTYTVQKHRETIRRKFGLTNKSENLTVFLQNMNYV